MAGFLSKLFGKGQASPEPRDLFATEVEDALRALPGVDKLKRDADEFAIDVEIAGQSQRLFLQNLFAESREMSPETRKGRIAAFVAGMLERDDAPWEQARAQCIPVLRGVTMAAALGPKASMVHRPFLPFLDVFAVVDTPTSMRYVADEHLRRWGVTEDDVMEVLAINTALLADPRVELHDDQHGPLWSVETGDAYETSRIFVPGFLSSFAGKVEGRPLAIMPERTSLFVGGDANPAMVARLIEKAEREFSASPRNISPALYTVDDGGKVVPYVRTPKDRLTALVAIGHEKLAIFEYGAQKSALEKLYAEEGKEDVFVASYKVYTDAEGMPGSVGIWTKGVPTLLPRVDDVLLGSLPAEGGEAPPPVRVRFSAVEHRLRKVEDLDPVRYETLDFPTPEELRALAGDA